MKLKKTIVILIISFNLVFFCSIIFFYNNNIGWNIKKLNINKVWKITKGENQVIAFIDTGISPELEKIYSNRIVAPYNVFKNNSDCTDKKGHGTEMITVACASGTKGIWGIAPNSKIMPICAIDSQGHTTAENISKGIYWAIEHNATIINLSLGKDSEDECVKIAINKAIEKKIYVVASAGDYGNPFLLFPANIPNVISVEAQNMSGDIYINSNYSDTATIAAPGNEIPVLSVNSNGKLFKKKSNGTSVATAEVSALLALSLSVNNNISRKDLIVALKNSVDATKFINATNLIKTINSKK